MLVFLIENRVSEDPPSPDLEKVVNRPQAENSELYNVLKIGSFES